MSLKFLANEPWAISQSGLELVVAVASKGEILGEIRDLALAARDGKPLDNARAVRLHGDVAAIPISGPLFRHADLLTDLSGATSYATLRKDLQAALDNPAVRAIVLDIDSPGGEATGVSELSRAIYEARGQKPIKAYVGGAAASAAYWIASAADEVVISDTAILGSIGVMAVYPKADDAGEIEFVSSQSPYKNAKPGTDAGKAKIQGRIDALAAVFVSAVAKNRGVSEARVLGDFGKGDVFVGAAAIKAGLADRLGSLESLLAEMVSPLVALGRGVVARSEVPAVGMSLKDFGRMEIA